MSKNKKKFEEEAMSDSESVSEDASDSSSTDSFCRNQKIQVDFEGRTPVDDNCHGISQLLSRIFLKAHVNCMQLAEIIIGQNDVGSVVVQANLDMDESDIDNLGDEETIFGVTTVINMTTKKTIPCIKEIFSYITERAQKHATENTISLLQSVFNNENLHIGFLVNERYINIPTRISIPLFETLVIEIEDAIAKGKKFKFDYCIMIIKKFRDMKHLNDPNNEHFSNEEEQIFEKNAAASFEFCVTDECDVAMIGDWLDNDEELEVEPFRKVLLIEANKLSKIVEELSEFIGKEE